MSRKKEKFKLTNINFLYIFKLSYWRLCEYLKEKKKKHIEEKQFRDQISKASGLSFHRSSSNNIGDKYSGPVNYFPALQSYAVVDIFTLKTRMDLKGKPVIIGGGGLLHEGFFRKRIELIIDSNPGPLIAWGIGYNSDIGTPQWKPDFLKLFSFIGLRDYNTPYDWVPCPSCLHPVFDLDSPVLHSAVLYNHWEFPIQLSFPIPELSNNNKSFDEVIKFLSSGETVITNSFHGAYWATLLGRKVVVVNPFSWKFYTFRHPPLISNSGQLDQAIEKAISYPNALKECRLANQNFASKVFTHLGAVV